MRIGFGVWLFIFFICLAGGWEMAGLLLVTPIITVVVCCIGSWIYEAYIDRELNSADLKRQMSCWKKYQETHPLPKNHTTEQFERAWYDCMEKNNIPLTNKERKRKEALKAEDEKWERIFNTPKSELPYMYKMYGKDE